MKRLLDGETVDFDGEFFKAKRARLYVKTERRPPIYLSAFHEGAAELAGRLADGVWTLGDPRKAAPVIAAYRRGAEEAGREPGEIILQTLAAWGDTDEAALEGSREWKGTLVDEHYTDPIADPAEIGRNGEEQVEDEQLESTAIVSADPDTHAKKLKALEKLGATAVCVMNCSGADPTGCSASTVSPCCRPCATPRCRGSTRSSGRRSSRWRPSARSRSSATRGTSRRSRRRGCGSGSRTRRTDLGQGARLRYRLSLFGVPVRWLTEIVEWKPPRTFVDLQLEGPYRLWEHTHRIRPVAGGTEIYDHVRYALPLDPLASLARPLTVERWLDAIFDFRARRVAELVR